MDWMVRVVLLAMVLTGAKMKYSPLVIFLLSGTWFALSKDVLFYHIVDRGLVSLGILIISTLYLILIRKHIQFSAVNIILLGLSAAMLALPLSTSGYCEFLGHCVP